MKWAQQTGFCVKLDTTTKCNRLKNIADKGNAVRRGECLFRKSKMAAQHYVYLACFWLYVCACVGAAHYHQALTQKTGKMKKKCISHIIYTITHLLVYIIMLYLPLASQNAIYN